MKKSAKRKATMFAPGESIRIVPLHHPKPSISIKDLALERRKREEGDQDLFDGKPHMIPTTAHLKYFGGPLLQNVEVYTIFWGKLWGTTASATAMANHLNAFFKAILASPLITQLGEYNVPGQKIGFGTLIGSKVIHTSAPVGSITDSAIRTQLKSWITAGVVPPPNKNRLYFIYLDPGIVSIMGGSKSCQNYCGYHDNVGRVYYAVMPFPTCNGCLGGMTAFNALTGTSSHELCEAITDPVPGSGWYDSVHGEIGDICAWHFKTVAGYRVQLEWSNLKNKCL